MGNGSFEKGTMESIKDSLHSRYKELGGIINEKDCLSALKRAENIPPKETSVKQAEAIAKTAGIVLNYFSGTDARVKLYAILRDDSNSDPEVKHHHSQMSDQHLFAETLRMLGDAESLNKLITAYPNISFG